MTITLSLTWWMIPTIILVVGLIWAFWEREDDNGCLGGINIVFRLVPVLAISLIAFIIGAIFK